ncbi:hypothetical protein A3C17_01940 [Candidatus Uhrbacteria bacterium RIFCSPHIGHO2_02_FULL_53_13]|uniref:Zinc finger DksA/TraR C4-type domain-containing protein n=2 Tax=Candidatus Uhriibacteriota TaxID=1752732 RepID=A0A1F7U0V1_9BACT|nr:MAG: hypothetical protein A3C17_01940 [Candidatus Uhrbacteria bacterium RIFCSPHIGHO2_02_FULL_53_13]OGL88845.1 MAG: hypothetical protein A3I45_02975 [Candidatus Uhrbacteria bacterium RIFCSPLOWO2_02_FULL_53_10]
MTKKQLQAIKEKLEVEKARIEAELAVMAHRNPQTSESDFEADYKDVGDDDDDNASEVAQYTSDLSVSSELEKTLRDIEKALASMKKGDYGLCKYCGDSIDPKRLEIRPTSSSCIACKKTFTKEA